MTQIGRFELDLEMRTLSCSGEQIHIGARAFDILALLASMRGRLVTKDELIRYVWPHTIVEENNLQVHLSTLRKALGTDRNLIMTLPGRGYQLAQNPPDMAQPKAANSGGTQGTLQPLADNLPLQTGELFGREAVIHDIAGMLEQAYAVTLVGAGGIGKTCLAVAVARHVANHFPDGVHFAALGAHSSTSAVLNAVANACGLALPDGSLTSARIARALGGKRCLVVLDNAEHVIEIVAELAETLTCHCPNLQVMTTSREPLRIAVETVFRVSPLDVPSIDAQCEDVLAHSAVRLFLHRARALQPDFAKDTTSVSLVGEVCRRLDGMPLAIELAAARATTFGIDGLRRRLDDRLKVLTGGCRNALPRHQTLRATFDWSYALLDQATRTVFRRLSRFADRFSLEDACSVAGDDWIDPMLVVMSISELTEKSLLMVEFEGTLTRYRLAESTRAYAREKLHDEGEEQRISAAHARWLQQRFATQWQCAGNLVSRDARDAMRNDLDDARSALDWAFSPNGDERLGVELTGALAEPLLAQSLTQECCTRVGVALEALERLPKGSVEIVCELRLHTAFAMTLLFTRGPVTDACRLWLEELTRVTEEYDDVVEARAMLGLFNAMLNAGRIHASTKALLR